MGHFHENADLGGDGWPQPSALLKSGAVGPPPPTFFIDRGDLKKPGAHSLEDVAFKGVTQRGISGERR